MGVEKWVCGKNDFALKFLAYLREIKVSETFFSLALSEKKLNPHESNIPAFHY